MIESIVINSLNKIIFLLKINIDENVYIPSPEAINWNTLSYHTQIRPRKCCEIYENLIEPKLKNILKSRISLYNEVVKQLNTNRVTFDLKPEHDLRNRFN